MSDIQTLNNEHFNKTAQDYDNIPLVQEFTRQASESTLREFAESTSEEYVQKAIVLDFGCGTGLCTFQVAPKVERVVGIDASEGMLNHLNLKLTSREENAHIRGKIRTIHHLVTHDAPLPEKETEYLAGPDGGFNMIFSSFVMHHIDDVQGIINTLAQKLLKKDGWLIVTDFQGPHDHHHQHGHEHGHEHGEHSHAHGDHHQHQHGQGDHPHHQGDHGHHGEQHQHQHGQEDHPHHQGDHRHHGQDIHDHFVDENGKPVEYVAHKGGFTPESLSEIFRNAGLVDVIGKHAFGMDRDMHGKKIKSDVLLVKGRRP